MSSEDFILYEYNKYTESEMLASSTAFYEQVKKRRSIRAFSQESFDIKVLENIILSAGTAPSGAHKQPWTFCVVASPEIKTKIRIAAEEEEYENYHGRMNDEWLKDLEKFKTNHIKEFLEEAPYLIVVFKKVYDKLPDGKATNYYVNESVGIAVGILLAAIQNAGLVALTHTPSPMNFLAKLLKRPENERAFLLIPVGFPAKDVKVPNLQRKSLEEISKYY